MTLLNTRTIVPQGTILKQYDYLDSTDFPTTTGLHVWNLAETVYSGVPVIGTDSLTLSAGSAVSNTNHIGKTTQTARSTTSSIWRVNTTQFDASNESFTISFWMKMGTQTTGTLCSKGPGGGGPNTSYEMFISTDNSIYFDLYTASSTRVQIITPPQTIDTDGLWHHYTFVYSQANTYIMILLDGKIISYRFDSSLSARYNLAGPRFALGAAGTTGGAYSGAGVVGAEISDVVYYKGVLTFDQIRRLYVVGTKKFAFIDELSQVSIIGEMDSGRFGGYQVNLILTTTLSTWSGRAVGIVYKTIDGAWRLRFNIGGTTSSSGTSVTFTVTGCTFKNANSQSVSITPTPSTTIQTAYASSGTQTIVCSSSTSNNIWYLSGDVELDSKPTIIY